VNADIGVRWEHARFRGELAGSATPSVISSTSCPRARAGGLRVYRYDRADAILLGGEASAEVAAQEHLTLRGRFDYVRAWKDESG
jgi:hypothetical protein